MDHLPDVPDDITLPAETCQTLAGNKRLQEEAMHLYFSGIFPTEIIEHLKLDARELHRFVFGADGSGTSTRCWHYLKLHRPRSSAVSYERVKPILLKTTEAKLMNRVKASVDEMEDGNHCFDLDGVGKAVAVIEKLDKITRLEEGKATSIVETNKKTFTLRDIAATAEEIDDADYTEMPVGDGEGDRDSGEDQEEDFAPELPSGGNGGTWGS